MKKVNEDNTLTICGLAVLKKLDRRGRKDRSDIFLMA